MSISGGLGKTEDVVVMPLIDSIAGQIKRTIDSVSHFQGQPREVLCVEFGKALVLLGCSFIGNAMRMDPDDGLQPARDCIEAFKTLAERAGGLTPPRSEEESKAEVDDDRIPY